MRCRLDALCVYIIELQWIWVRAICIVNKRGGVHYSVYMYMHKCMASIVTCVSVLPSYMYHFLGDHRHLALHHCHSPHSPQGDWEAGISQGYATKVLRECLVYYSTINLH